MKKRKLLLLLAVTSLALVSCGKRKKSFDAPTHGLPTVTDAVTEATSTEAKSTVATNTEATSTDTEENIEPGGIDTTPDTFADVMPFYDPILKESKQCLLDMENQVYDNDYPNLSDNGIFLEPGLDYSSFEFLIKDVNEDGVDELLLFSGNRGIYLLTIRDKKVMPIFVSFMRSGFSMGNDGLLYYIGSNGASDTAYARYELSEDGSCLQFVDGIHLYYDMTTSTQYYIKVDSASDLFDTEDIASKPTVTEDVYKEYESQFDNITPPDYFKEATPLSNYN